MKWLVTFPLFAPLVSQVALDVVQGGLLDAAQVLFALTPGIFLASAMFGLYRRKWL